MVLFHEANKVKNSYTTTKVVKVKPGADGLKRSCKVGYNESRESKNPAECKISGSQ